MLAVENYLVSGQEVGHFQQSAFRWVNHEYMSSYYHYITIRGESTSDLLLILNRSIVTLGLLGSRVILLRDW
jgi:hypothetical protein